MTENNHEDKEKGFLFYIKEWLPYIIIGISLFLIAWIYFFSAIRDSYWLPIHKDNAEILGVFGDFFGGTLNPILTFIALIFIIKSYRMQKEEFKALCKANEELSQTNKEQLIVLKTQNKQDLTFKILDKWEILPENNVIYLQHLQEWYENFLRNHTISQYDYRICQNDFIGLTQDFHNTICKIKNYSLFFNDFKSLWETEKNDKDIAKQLFGERFKEYFAYCPKIGEALKKVETYLNEKKNITDNQKEELYKHIREQEDLFIKEFQDLIVFYKENFEEKK